ncbi:DUF3370 domain-containing protein [Pseudanabaena sp. FACHB-2040]|uniref:DUF3370 domain-containing protein n=1 Tax=Pseudanabaena sp. FACHB-2040 TaxID=2692859 RepID=UPI00168838C3|nr:DUF3370 domain-containing protein [Pseudanabaena sp. FACHB-2040]MBD2260697.1 DUF3370 domain-containing protein [Pseudanabaena sp. FACHB-2040]
MLTALAALTLTPVLSQTLPASTLEPGVSEPSALVAPAPPLATGAAFQPEEARPFEQPRTLISGLASRLSEATLVASDPQHYAEVVQQQDVRPLPGQLDQVPVFNSNSPEVIQSEGILLSTFPAEGMRTPQAHLNFPFQGRFDIFAHHIARGVSHDDRRTLFLGVLVHNPGDQPVTVEVLQGMTYLSQEAPFRELPSTVLNPNGTIYAGPGSRTTTDLLRGQNQSQWPREVVIPPGHVHLLMNVPIPLRQLTVPVNGTYPQGSTIPKPAPSQVTVVAATAGEAGIGLGPGDVVVVPRPNNQPLPSNGRTAMMYLSSSGPVHVASLAMYAPPAAGGAERVPALREWIDLLRRGSLAGPRDIPPTNPETYRAGRFYYGRVAGVARGSQWSTLVTDGPDTTVLSIPQPGDAFSYVLSTVDRNTFGTGQIQSAPMLVRYPDTAFRAHGNYGIRYSLTMPLYNPTGSTQSVELKLQTPLPDEGLKGGLRFRQPPENRVFFRGTVRLRYANQLGVRQTHYVHLVQRRGQEGDPLVKLNIPAGERREVEIDLIYPPDATPPQVLTVQTVNSFNVIEAGSPNPTAQPLSREPSLPAANP